jgi:phosphohistidine phosphatase SixA
MLRALILLALITAAAARAETPSPELIAALRAGGHVIFFRHAFADQGIDEDPKALGPCAKQRQLSPKGRGQAKAIGAALAALGIPVGRVVSSPYCRAMETTAIAFGPMEVDHRLRLWQGELTEREKEELPLAVKRMLGASPLAGNTVLVSHNSKDALGIDLDQGEAAIVLPGGGENFRVLLQVKPGEWQPAAKVADDVPPPSWIVAEYPLDKAAVDVWPSEDGSATVEFGRTAATVNSLTGIVHPAEPRGRRASLVQQQGTFRIGGETLTILPRGEVAAGGIALALTGGGAPIVAAYAAGDRLWIARQGRSGVLVVRRP